MLSSFRGDKFELCLVVIKFKQLPHFSAMVLYSTFGVGLWIYRSTVQPSLPSIRYVLEHIGRLVRMSVFDTEVYGSNPGSSMLFP